MVILQGSHIPLSSIPVEQTAFGIITALSNWEPATARREAQVFLREGKGVREKVHFCKTLDGTDETF